MYNGPQRKNLRLKNYDYSQDGFYFVTICTKERQDFFGEIIEGKMILNEYGKIAEKSWNEIIKHYQNVEIKEFIIMPNHIHGIIIIVGNEYFRSDNEYFTNENNGNENNGNENNGNENNGNENNGNENNGNENNGNENNGNENIHSLPNLSNVIKGFKIGCTKEIRNKYNDFVFGWQKSFFDVIVRNDEQLEKTRQYIINNPLKWELDVNNKKNEEIVKKLRKEKSYK